MPLWWKVFHHKWFWTSLNIYNGCHSQRNCRMAFEILPDVAQYGAQANSCAAGTSNKEASRVCLSHCKNCINVASITFTLRFPKHEFLPRTTFCRDFQYGRTSTARNCPSCTTFRDRQITSGAINTCSAAVNATAIYDYNDAEIRFAIRRCECLMWLKGIHAEEI